MENNKTFNEKCDIIKKELLAKINQILEVLPESECQRIYDYLSELYFS